MSQLEKVFERIDSYRDDVIKLQAELTSRIALGPDNEGTGEHEKIAFVKDLLKEVDPDFLEEIKAPDERARDGYRPSLVAGWGEMQGKSSVWVLSHADIVPPGDLSLWETDPYQIKVEGDLIFGRGVEDNQHGFVSSYLALKAVLGSDHETLRPVCLAIVADEETGSKYGLQYLLQHHKDLFKKDDLIVVPDAGNEEGTMIEVAEKSMLWIRFIVKGKQCHASTPGKGKNSLFGAARLIVALDQLKARFDLSDDLFRPSVSTFEPTKMEANVPNINTIPGRNIFYLDCRVLPLYKVDEILAACKEIGAEIGKELGLQIEVKAAHREDAAEPTSADAPVVKALIKAIRKVTGKDAKPMGIGGGTFAAFFRKAGLPAAVWSTISETAHQPNEYCLISNILTDAKVLACLYLDEL